MPYHWMKIKMQMDHIEFFSNQPIAYLINNIYCKQYKYFLGMINTLRNLN